MYRKIIIDLYLTPFQEELRNKSSGKGEDQVTYV
jgi:hypothetical protein